MDDDDYMYFAGSVNTADCDTVAWFDSDDAEQDGWLGLLSGERGDPGRLRRLDQSGRLPGYLWASSKNSMFKARVRQRRIHRNELAWVGRADGDVGEDMPLVRLPGKSSQRLWTSWTSLVDMYGAPSSSRASVSEEWAAKARRFVRPAGGSHKAGTWDTYGVLRMLDDWDAGRLDHVDVVLLFLPWVSVRPRAWFTEPFLLRVTLPSDAVMRDVAWVLRRVGCHADAAWNGALAEATWVHGRSRPPAHRPAGALGSGRYSVLMSSEEPVAAWLDRNGVPYLVQQSFPTLARGFRLVFDFLLPDHRVLIEVQTDTHATDPDVQERDQMKRDWAADNGWRLVEVWGCDDLNVALGGLRRSG